MNRPSPNQADAMLGKQRRDWIVEFLAEYHVDERVAPTRQTLAYHLGISYQAVCKHVALLITQGVVEDMGGSRGLRLTR